LVRGGQVPSDVFGSRSRETQREKEQDKMWKRYSQYQGSDNEKDDRLS